MLTIDASVWVNADSPAEVGSGESRAFLEHVATSGIPVVVPTLLCVEVAAAISRARRDPVLAREYSDRLALLPFIRWVALDESLARHAATLAAAHALRGADAVYAAVAIAHRCELISLDQEHLQKMPGVLRVRAPRSPGAAT